MAEFSAEHREELGGRFEEGVHKVKIMTVVSGETEKDGKEYIEITVIKPEDDSVKANVRLWFTTDAAIRYSYNILKGIFVHNAPEKEKDSTRARFDELKNTEELVEAANKVLIGAEAWYLVAANPERNYVKEGKEYKGYDRNIYGYEPKMPTPPAQKVVTEPKTGDGEQQPFGF